MNQSEQPPFEELLRQACTEFCEAEARAYDALPCVCTGVPQHRYASRRLTAVLVAVALLVLTALSAGAAWPQLRALTDEEGLRLWVEDADSTGAAPAWEHLPEGWACFCEMRDGVYVFTLQAEEGTATLRYCRADRAMLVVPQGDAQPWNVTVLESAAALTPDLLGGASMPAWPAQNGWWIYMGGGIDPEELAPVLRENAV